MKVRIKVPEGCIEEDIEEYVREAVDTWCKHYDPGSYGNDPDPRFNIDEHIVSIRRTKR